MQRISLTQSEFSTLRPLNGHVIVKSSTDQNITGKTDLIIDTTFKPENHQEIQNIVVKVPDRMVYSGDEVEMKIDVLVGSEVIINYFPILNAPILDVEGVIYRMVPYMWVIMELSPVPRMLGDWLLVDKLREVVKSELKVEGKLSKKYFEVVMPINGSFKYLKRDSRYLKPNAGDRVCLVDSAVFALEDDLHLHFDGKKHYVAKAWKVLGIVDAPDHEIA